jgi:hypothetical protein
MLPLIPGLPALLGAAVAFIGKSVIQQSCMPSLPAKGRLPFLAYAGGQYDERFVTLDSTLRDAQERVNNGGTNDEAFQLMAIEQQIQIMKDCGCAEWEFEGIMGDLRELAKDSPLDIDTF